MIVVGAFLVGTRFPVHLAEGAAQVLGRAAFDGTGEDVPYGVEGDVGLFLVIVAHQLALVLGADDNGHLILTRGIDEVVQAFQVDGGQFVNQYGRVQPPRHVDNLEELAHEHGQCGAVHALAAGIVAHADDLGLVGVVDVQGEIVPGGVLCLYSAWSYYELTTQIPDAVKFRGKIGMDVCTEIVKTYMRRRDKNLTKLMNYAAQMRVARIMTNYIEILA